MQAKNAAEDFLMANILRELGIYPHNSLTLDFQNRFHQKPLEAVHGFNVGWCDNCYHGEVESGNDTKKFLRTRHITFHQYKADRRANFEKLDNVICHQEDDGNIPWAETMVLRRQGQW